jgi:hypothetical protein
VRILLLLALAVCACDFDTAFTEYCAGNPACAGSGGSLAPGGTGGGGSGGTGGRAGSGGSGGMAGSGGEAGSGGWSPATYCDSHPDCGDGEVCDLINHVCLRACEDNTSCSLPEKICKTVGFGTAVAKGCTCSDPRDCAAAFPGTTCHPYTLTCERSCRGDNECAIYDGKRPYCQKITNVCVACVSNTQCPDVTPHCRSQGDCWFCGNAADCAGRPDQGTCKRGKCVAP